MICALPGLARAYEAAGQLDSAVAVYERYVETPFMSRFWGGGYHFGPLLGPTYEKLGSLLEARGDRAGAARYYGKLAELWKDADPELRPRAEAAGRKAESLGGT